MASRNRSYPASEAPSPVERVRAAQLPQTAAATAANTGMSNHASAATEASRMRKRIAQSIKKL
ncbi:hypothetical protein ACIP98_25180 [Streptomyces sp. NPDC088354]|uniref:hypothetical protein n=1 Tax=unclassified Streptomyces TaxID=2593676 RepID=UPI0029B3DFAE|nr:hypothetical protein [Streptomyces sp. MI02-7b]MDX3077709.1 hypothetical protein [Streptomyces sp. MI02-7b]